MFEIERRVPREEKRVLPALRPEPKAVLTTKNIDMRLEFARRDQFAVDPSKTRAFETVGRAGHHASLPGGNHSDLGLPGRIGQCHDTGIILQEFCVITKRAGGLDWTSMHGC